MAPIYTPADWYWRSEDGRIFSSQQGKEVTETDTAFAAWSEAGGIPTVWPRDDAGEQTQAALDAVLAAAGVVPTVPISVTSAQAKIALNRANYLVPVRHAIEALGDPEVEIWFSDARTWERSNKRIVEIGEAVGLTAAEIDALFQQAAQITV